MTRCQALTAVVVGLPPILWAASNPAVVGSLNAYGMVRLGATLAPTGATVFDGQVVSPGAGSHALVTLHAVGRASITLGPDSRARIGRSDVVLDRGGALFQTSPASPARMFAAGLRLDPQAEDTAVEASVDEAGRVNVAVTSGALAVVDPSGEALKTIPAGQAYLFGLADQAPAEQPKPRSGGQAPGVPKEKPEAKTPPPEAPQPAPEETARKGGGSRTGLYVLLGVGAAGGALAVAMQSKRGS